MTKHELPNGAIVEVFEFKDRMKILWKLKKMSPDGIYNFDDFLSRYKSGSAQKYWLVIRRITLLSQKLKDKYNWIAIDPIEYLIKLYYWEDECNLRMLSANLKELWVKFPHRSLGNLLNNILKIGLRERTDATKRVVDSKQHLSVTFNNARSQAILDSINLAVSRILSDYDKHDFESKFDPEIFLNLKAHVYRIKYLFQMIWVIEKWEYKLEKYLRRIKIDNGLSERAVNKVLIIVQEETILKIANITEDFKIVRTFDKVIKELISSYEDYIARSRLFQ